MEHTEKPTDEEPRDGPGSREGKVPRPDLQGPRGNQEVEQQDVERGQGKLERVLGW